MKAYQGVCWEGQKHIYIIRANQLSFLIISSQIVYLVKHLQHHERPKLLTNLPMQSGLAQFQSPAVNFVSFSRNPKNLISGNVKSVIQIHSFIFQYLHMMYTDKLLFSVMTHLCIFIYFSSNYKEGAQKLMTPIYAKVGKYT